MVEYFELYKLLGATKFYVYVDTIGTDVSWIIDFYKGEGIVEAISWDIQIGTKFKFSFQNLSDLKQHF